MSNLVIVESPAKAKTIAKYLGDDYTVKASMGHLRDLPRSKMGVDIKGGFIPQYQPIDGKEKMISELKKSAKASENVYLATDPDREGEAISWHLKELLGLDGDKAIRVTFNEITKPVVTESIKKPRLIDMDLVNAQQARRVLDRIVGYELSPLLWRKIKRGLSAGRVQSVCTRIVVDREEEIRAFVPEEYWSLEVRLTRPQSGKEGFTARFVGNEQGKMELKTEQEAGTVLDAVRVSPFSVKNVKIGKKQRSPVPPFITSTMQQDASRKLNMTSRRTMSIAQQLYEGIDIKGQGMTGLITYMRTDSLRLSEEAINEVREYVRVRFGAEYVPASPKRYKSSGNAQDAHEAIRPTSVEMTPEKLKADLTSDQYRLYKLIWERFVACQMENAVYNTLSIDTLSAGYVFRANNTSVRFPGFTAVYEEGRDDEGEQPEEALPDLKAGEPLELLSFKPGQHFTQPPARFNEATLIQTMEKNGVGRPSTYAPTISTILGREYVRKEGRALFPTPLGEVVTKLMKDKFADIVDVEFTARMESNLDQIEEGKKDWRKTLEEFYSDFSAEKEKAEQELEKVSIKIPDEETSVVCDLCGRKMVIKHGRFGRFLACPGYPECKNTKPIAEETVGECLLCGGVILKKKSKNGYTYYGCTNHPKCGFMTWDMPVKDKCPECGKSLFRRQGKGFCKPYCINPECPDFLPEDKRGYKKKAATEKTGEQAGTDNAETEKPASRVKKEKAAAAPKKPAGTKKTAAPAAEKPASTRKKAAKPAGEKPAGTKKAAAPAAEKPAGVRKKAAASAAEKPVRAAKKTEGEKAKPSARKKKSE